MFTDSCPECGALKPSFLGGSHFKRGYPDSDVEGPACGGRSDEEFWRLTSGSMRLWPVR